MRLRAHHLLCLQTFRGKGYSPEFTANMTRVKEELEKDESVQVEIVSGADDICRACPHLKEGGCCDKEKQVKLTDERAAIRIGLASGEGRYRDLKSQAMTVFESGDLPEICGCCQWLDLCLKLSGGKK